MATPPKAATASPAKPDAVLAAWVRDARQKTLEVVADLSDEQLMGPQLRIVNPLLWEIGHVTWFAGPSPERWTRACGSERGPLSSGSPI